tara:strand:- start:4326 stop:4709 length:384 start_codon:yes stop_codon:yes gene_type:complete
MSLFGSKETRKANNGNPVEKAAVDAEAAKYRMKKQEYQAKQGDYAIKMQAQQQAMQPQPVAQPVYQQTPQIPQERDLGGYTQPKPRRKAKKPQKLSQWADDFGKKHGGWNKNVLTKAEERRWKKNYG